MVAEGRTGALKANDIEFISDTEFALSNHEAGTVTVHNTEGELLYHFANVPKPWGLLFHKDTNQVRRKFPRYPESAR